MNFVIQEARPSTGKKGEGEGSIEQPQAFHNPPPAGGEGSKKFIPGSANRRPKEKKDQPDESN